MGTQEIAVGVGVALLGIVLASRSRSGRSTGRGGQQQRQPVTVNGVAYLQARPSPGFSWEDWERSSTAAQYGIDNRVRNAEHQQNIIWTSTFLDALADLAGAPVVITSGYRTPALNTRVEGSASQSRHMTGEAVDFKIPSRFATSFELARFVHDTGWPFQKIGVYDGEARIHLQYIPRAGEDANSRRFVYDSGTEQGIAV